MPNYDSTRFSPPAPVALVTLRNPEGGAMKAGVSMLLDTGADVTLLPQVVADELGLGYSASSYVRFALQEFIITITRCLLNMKTLIRNGRVVTAVDDYRADMLIEGETVSTIGAKLDVEADVVIDAAGKLVIPGGIDPHTHMELPFGGTQASDDFHTGTVAAAHGGTTTIIDFAVQYKGQALREGLDAWHAKAEGKAVD